MISKRNMSDKEPNYIALFRSGELARRADTALKMLEECRICPRQCGARRLWNETGFCGGGRYARVACHGPHFGEERCLSGRNGSGTIFFSWCNLKCVFCQNFDISHGGEGIEVSPEKLGQMMIELQDMGCHNINWVTPEHAVPQILEALPHAVRMGLTLPIIYNTSGYDSTDLLHQLDGIVDVYMPDFKFWDPRKAEKYLNCPEYPGVVREAIQEMHRQVGDLELDSEGWVRRGLLVRHLVMPNGCEDGRKIMEFLAQEISPHTYVNIMDQYYPAGKVGLNDFPEINRRITPQEFSEVFRAAQKAGLHRFDRK